MACQTVVDPFCTEWVDKVRTSQISLNSVSIEGELEEELEYRINMLEMENAQLKFQKTMLDNELEHKDRRTEQYRLENDRLNQEILVLKTRIIELERSDFSSLRTYSRPGSPLGSPINIQPGRQDVQHSLGDLGIQANRCCLNPFCIFFELIHDGLCKAVPETYMAEEVRFMGSPTQQGFSHAAHTAPTSPPKSTRSRRSRHARSVGKIMPHLPVKEETNAHSKDKKAPTYNGVARWSEYLAQFNLVAKLNQWDDETKALQLATSLTDDARSVLMEVTNLTWEDLVKKLEAKYEPKDQKAVYQAMLRCRTRKGSESLPDLMSDIKRMIRRAYPTADDNMKEELCVKHFEESLDDAAMEWAVHDKSAEVTSDGALAAAMNYEAFQVGRNKRQERQSSPDWRNQDLSAQVRKIMLEEKEASQNETEDLDPREKRMEERKKKMEKLMKTHPCHLCKELGHWKRDCPMFLVDDDAGNED